MKYSAIDLHSNNNVLVVTDETDRVLVEKRLPNELDRVLALLAPHKDELTGVVVESTYNWYWLVDGLMAAGYDVKLANTVAIKVYDGLKYSGDEADARHLAHLLRLGMLNDPRQSRGAYWVSASKVPLLREPPLAAVHSARFI